MKTRYLVYKRMVFLFILVAFLLAGCSKVREKEYYADLDNFITGEAIVDNIIYDNEEEHIVLWLSEIDEVYQCNDFIIEGDNTEVVLDNGILEKIKPGDAIQYTSAPRFFGNGDFMPIIEISAFGEELLNIEVGHENLMKTYQ